MVDIQSRHEFLIVSEKNETVGNITAERMNGVLWLTNLWTHHEYRRKGYARALLNAAIAECGSEDLWLKVHPYTNRPLDEAALTALYTSFGFEQQDAPGIMRRRHT